MIGQAISVTSFSGTLHEKKAKTDFRPIAYRKPDSPGCQAGWLQALSQSTMFYDCG
jgi:hypothetical protein